MSAFNVNINHLMLLYQSWKITIRSGGLIFLTGSIGVNVISYMLRSIWCAMRKVSAAKQVLTSIKANEFICAGYPVYLRLLLITAVINDIQRCVRRFSIVCKIDLKSILSSIIYKTFNQFLSNCDESWMINLN